MTLFFQILEIIILWTRHKIRHPVLIASPMRQINFKWWIYNSIMHISRKTKVAVPPSLPCQFPPYTPNTHPNLTHLSPKNPFVEQSQCLRNYHWFSLKVVKVESLYQAGWSSYSSSFLVSFCRSLAPDDCRPDRLIIFKEEVEWYEVFDCWRVGEVRSF